MQQMGLQSAAIVAKDQQRQEDQVKGHKDKGQEKQAHNRLRRGGEGED